MSQHSPNLIRRLTDDGSVLSKSESKVARFVLDNAHDVGLYAYLRPRAALAG
jgi:DNA-binding MurR/RpiR family transcriptional regulator